MGRRCEAFANAKASGEGSAFFVDEDDYADDVRAEIAETLSMTPEGEWAELALCPGPYGCPFESSEDALAAGVEEHFCPHCRVIRLYRAKPPLR